MSSKERFETCERCSKELKEGDTAYVVTKVIMTDFGYEPAEDVAIYCPHCDSDKISFDSIDPPTQKGDKAKELS